MNPGRRITMECNSLMGRVTVALIIVAVVSLGTSSAFAQSDQPGRITGKVIDAATGDPLIGVTVMIQGTTMGAATDLDGLYTIKSVPPGTYTLKISSVGYSELIVEEVEVTAGEMLKMEFPLQSQAIEQETVVVTGKRYTNTQAALQVQRRKARQVMDAISTEEISNAGSGNAAEAMTKVVGATVMDQDVYVRGLGDRYSNYLLNGAQMPTSDPNKQSVPMDIVPTHLLDNIVVTKTFTPDKPGNFSGGSVDLVTKDFPDRRSLSVSISGGGKTNTAGDDQFITAAKHIEEIPAIWNEPWVDSIGISTFVREQALADSIARLNESMSRQNVIPTRKTGPFNGSVKASYGDQLTFLGRKLGINGNIGYSESSSHYTDGTEQGWSFGSRPEQGKRLHDTKSSEETLTGWMGSLIYSLRDNHKLGLRVVGNRGTEVQNQYLEGMSRWQLSDNIDRVLQARALTYTEKDLNSFQITGDHLLRPGFEIRADWMVSFSQATLYKPDQRFFENTVDTNTVALGVQDSLFRMDGTEVGTPARYYRDIEEQNDEYAANFTIPLGNITKFKTGFSVLQKERSHDDVIFQYGGNDLFEAIGGDWQAWIDSTGYRVAGSPSRPLYIIDNRVTRGRGNSKSYDGNQDITGIYALIELPLTDRLLLITGLRYEHTDMLAYNGWDPSKTGPGQYAEGSIDEEDWLPSANFIYRLTDFTNFRVVYGRTMARPTMREFAPYQNAEYGSGVEYAGNPELKRTLIDNWDLRAETFPRPGEVMAVSLFYKDLKNPIELELLGTNQNIIKARNLDNGLLFGAEFELTKKLDFISQRFRNFDFSANFTLSHSKVDKPETEYVYDIAKWEDSPRTREMLGQAPYVINFSLGYLHETSQTTVNFHYNRVGDRFAYATGGGTPNVFEKPRDMLDIIATQSLGAGLKLKLSAKNVLGADYERRYEEFNGVEHPYNIHPIGSSVSLGMTWSL